jgi:large subunit ribosomal protein L21e
MTTSGKGSRSKTRSRLAGAKRKKFKVEPFLQDFSEGQKVAVKQDPSSHGGMPHIRFKGRVATVKSRRGEAYVLSVKVGRTVREIIARPEHLKPIKQ